MAGEAEWSALRSRVRAQLGADGPAGAMLTMFNLWMDEIELEVSREEVSSDRSDIGFKRDPDGRPIVKEGGSGDPVIGKLVLIAEGLLELKSLLSELDERLTALEGDPSPSEESPVTEEPYGGHDRSDWTPEQWANQLIGELVLSTTGSVLHSDHSSSGCSWAEVSELITKGIRGYASVVRSWCSRTRLEFDCPETRYVTGYCAALGQVIDLIDDRMGESH